MSPQEINNLLHKLPDSVEDKEQLIEELDSEEIPWARVPKLKELMLGKDDFLAVEAAKLLANWGVVEGFDFLESFVCEREPYKGNWMPHRLRNYDDSYKHILLALKRYWAHESDKGNGETARKRLLRPVLRIIGLSNLMQFGLDYFFALVERENFTEYIPALKVHLEAILKKPEFHHWKVGDCAHLLMKFDPDFVTQALAKYGKTLADYPNK